MKSPRRVEDGCGTCSSANWVVPCDRDYLGPLRQRWMATLQHSGLFACSLLTVPLHCLRLTSTHSCRTLEACWALLRTLFGLTACPFRGVSLFVCALSISLPKCARSLTHLFADQLCAGVSLGVGCQPHACPQSWPQVCLRGNPPCLIRILLIDCWKRKSRRLGR